MTHPATLAHPSAHATARRLPRRVERASAAPLLAVCGVCGGAGASTLSDLIASLAAARERGTCSSPTPADRAAACPPAPACRRRASLAEAAELLVRDSRPRPRPLGRRRRRRPRCERRVIAAAPAPAPARPTRARLGALLAILRGDLHHALVVIDCGTLQRAADRLALRRASHVAWVLPDTDRGVAPRRAPARAARAPPRRRAS